MYVGQSSAQATAEPSPAEVFISNGQSLEETVAALRDDIVRCVTSRASSVKTPVNLVTGDTMNIWLLISPPRS